MAKKKKRTNNQTAKQTESTSQNQPTNTKSADAMSGPDSNTNAVERPWLPWLLLVLTVAGIYFNQLTGYSLIDPGETINSESARQMLLLKNYFAPYCNYQIDSHSFVLPSWLVALSYQLSAPGALTARLPFAIVAALLVFSTYLTTKRLVDRESALTAALMTVSAPLLLVSTKTDTTSLSFALCLDLALYATALAIFARVKHIWLLLWIALALAILCRGPVALALYAIALSLFFVATKVKLSQLTD
jgi:4-amino-4-deoxy-L-arabinose transferase-like glycosyltransferase